MTTIPSTSNFDKLLESSFQQSAALEGSVVKGQIIDIQNDIAIIDVGLKSEGRVPLKEFAKDGQVSLQVGDVVDVYIERYEDRQGDIILSHEKAHQEATWQRLLKAFEEGQPVEGRITQSVKGGLTVDLGGTMAFLPGSHIDIRPVKDPSSLIGSTLNFMILKIDESRCNVVLSHRAVLEKSRSAGRQALLASLEQGQVLKGVVKNITDYGVFVDLGGIDGLLHVTDISWKRVQHPSEVLSVGQTISVVVTRFNKETQRISLGMKQLEKDPWQDIDTKYHVGDKVMGTVTNITDYGAFVELDEGVEGLIYVAEMSWNKKNVVPSQIVSPGQAVQVMILDVDRKTRRISLGYKQCTPNPFEKFEKTYPVGNAVEGTVKEITEFGLIVQLPEGIDGTIHKSELSWTQSGDEVLKQYQAGDRIKIKILSINVPKEIIGLSVRQLSENPYKEEFEALHKGDTVQCEVIKILDSGIEVKVLGTLLTSVIRKADLSRNREEQYPDRFSVGQTIEAKIITLNPEARRITLSIKAQEMEDEREAMAEYADQSGSEEGSLGSLLETALSAERKNREKEDAS